MIDTIEDGPSTIELDWGNVEDYSLKIANAFANSNIDAIVAIGRGGFVPAVIISHALGASLLPVQWETHTNGFKTDLEPIVDSLPCGAVILIVDDVSYTGKTMSEVMSKFMAISTDKSKDFYLHTAALIQKHDSLYYVSEFGEEIADEEWVVFPWEN